ncbi:MAG: hypothetical protein ABIJ46_02155 [bacterium]
MSVIDTDRETAEQYLSDVEPAWRSFWFGPQLMARNLEQFSAGLDRIDDQTYDFHVRGHERQLSRWMREVVGDGALADELDRVRTRDEAAAVVRQRVAELRRLAGRK